MAEFGSPAVSSAEPLRGYWSLVKALQVAEWQEDQCRTDAESASTPLAKVARADLRESLRSGDIFAVGLCEETGDLVLLRQQFWRAKIIQDAPPNRALDPFDEAVEGRKMDLGNGVQVIPMIAQADLCNWMGAHPPPAPLERPPGWPGPELASRAPRSIPDWARDKRPLVAQISKAPPPPRTVRGIGSWGVSSPANEPHATKPQDREARSDNTTTPPDLEVVPSLPTPVRSHPGGRPPREGWAAFQREVTRRLALDGGNLTRTAFRREMKDWVGRNMLHPPDERTIERKIDDLVLPELFAPD